MTTTLGHALLGLLAREPLTGYELTSRLRAPVGYFWTATHSQVYPELARLEEAALIESEVVAGPGPRDNKRHRITEAGRTELAEWVVTPAPQNTRDEFMLRVYSLWLADRDAAEEMVRAQLARHETSLAAYAGIESGLLAEHPGGLPPVDHPDFASYATLRRGISFERHALSWCRWLLRELRRATAD